LASLVAGASLLLSGCQTPAPGRPEPSQAAESPSSAFEPAKGVRCDRSTKICEYKGGPTVGLTRLFFGDGAADALTPQMREAGYPFDPIFKPTSRASCDTLVTTCYDEGGASLVLTQSYFGDEARTRLEKRLRQPGGSSSAIVRYGEVVTCDEMSGVCYDRLGAGVFLTREYLSQEHAERLLARLRPRKPEPPPNAPEAEATAEPETP